MSSSDPVRYVRVRRLFLRLLAVVYAIAFVSLAVQIVGLYGADDLHGVRCYERKGQRKEQREEEIVEWTTSVITKLEDEDFLDHSSGPLLPALTRWK